MNKLLWMTVALNLSLMGGACSDDRPSESSGTEAVDPGKADSANEDGTCKPASYARNWGKNPAVVRIADRQRTLYALSDVHGEPVDLFEMLESAGLVSGSLKKPAWIGGKSLLVLAGDSLNKGDRSLDVLDLLMKLEEKAKDAGGALIALAGNHEIAFLAYPTHPKLAKILQSAEDKGLSLCKDVHSPRSAYGAWLRNRPIAAVINGIFISHTGNAEDIPYALYLSHYIRELGQSGGLQSQQYCRGIVIMVNDAHFRDVDLLPGDDGGDIPHQPNPVPGFNLNTHRVQRVRPAPVHIN